MKKKMALMVVFCCIMCITALLPLCASAEESGTCGTNLTWVLDDNGTLTISGTGAMTSNPWLSWRSSIKTVVIEDGVTSISEYAFQYCTALTSITIPDSVTSIGGSSAFSDCTALTSVYITDLAAWCEISFYNGLANPLRYGADLCLNGKKVRNLVIPDEVTTITDYAFFGCGSILRVTIPDSVTSIGQSVFNGCKSLTSITIPDSVTSIGNNAFRNCSGLTSITIPDSVKSIGDYTFDYCTGLTDITIGDGVTNIGYGAFNGCTGLTDITIGNSVTMIGKRAFWGCSRLTSITIPASVTWIGESAFAYCNGLKNVYITDLSSWCKISFYYDVDTFTTSSPLNYGADLYLNGEMVQDLVIPDEVTTIKDYAFRNCKSLTSVTIPDCVTSIGKSAFGSCSGLADITIGNGVTNIGESAFQGCSSLTGMNIPDSVTSIGNYAFSNCGSLKSVYITDLVSWCEIKFNSAYATPLYNGADLYLNEKKVTKLVIPDDVEYIENYAFYNCKSITSVVLPLNLMGMGNSAFYGCDNITYVYYCGSEEDWDFLIIGTDNECLTNATIHFNYNPDVKIVCEAKKDGIHITAENVEEENKVFAITMVDGVANATKLDLTDGEETMEVSEGVGEVKIFVWESLESMRPLTEPILVEVK